MARTEKITRRTLDTAEVLAHAPATTRKLLQRGNAVLTFKALDHDPDACTVRNCKCLLRWSGKEGRFLTPVEAAGRKLRAVRASGDNFAQRGFRELTIKPSVPVGTWVRTVLPGEKRGEYIDGMWFPRHTVGQVWSDGQRPDRVWVAFAGHGFEELHPSQLVLLGATGSDVDSLFEFEATDAADDATDTSATAAVAPQPFAQPIGPVPAPTCTHCGADAPHGLEDLTTSIIGKFCAGAHCLTCTDNDAAIWHGRATFCTATAAADATPARVVALESSRPQVVTVSIPDTAEEVLAAIDATPAVLETPAGASCTLHRLSCGHYGVTDTIECRHSSHVREVLELERQAAQRARLAWYRQEIRAAWYALQLTR